jgi:hypothetical protein
VLFFNKSFNIQGDSELLSGFPWSVIFKPEIKSKRLLSIESVVQNAKQLQHAPFMAHKQFYFVVSALNIIGHGNSDSKLESSCTCKNLWDECVLSKWHIC